MGATQTLSACARQYHGVVAGTCYLAETVAVGRGVVLGVGGRACRWEPWRDEEEDDWVVQVCSLYGAIRGSWLVRMCNVTEVTILEGICDALTRRMEIVQRDEVITSTVLPHLYGCLEKGDPCVGRRKGCGAESGGGLDSCRQ